MCPLIMHMYCRTSLHAILANRSIWIPLYILRIWRIFDLQVFHHLFSVLLGLPVNFHVSYFSLRILPIRSLHSVLLLSPNIAMAQILLRIYPISYFLL